MIIFQYDPPIDICGRRFTVLCRIQLKGTKQKGAVLFTGDKQPLAVICRGDDGEETIGLDGEPLDTAALGVLVNAQTA